MHRFAVVALVLAGLAPAQEKPASPQPPAVKPAPAPPAGWLDLAVGTDLVYLSSGDDVIHGGTTLSMRIDHWMRVVVVAVEPDGKVRLALLDETQTQDKTVVPIVRAGIALIDPATGKFAPADAGQADPGADIVSVLVDMPLPPLSVLEWKDRKSVHKDACVAIAGEPQVLPLGFSFTTRKRGKTLENLLVADLGRRQPVPIKPARLGVMVAPADARVSALHREYSIDPERGRVLEIRTTSTVTAAGGKVTIESSDTTTRINHDQLDGELLAPFAAAVAEISAITNSKDDKQKRTERAKALKANAERLGLTQTVDRLIDSIARG